MLEWNQIYLNALIAVLDSITVALMINIIIIFRICVIGK